MSLVVGIQRRMSLGPHPIPPSGREGGAQWEPQRPSLVR